MGAYLAETQGLVKVEKNNRRRVLPGRALVFKQYVLYSHFIWSLKQPNEAMQSYFTDRETEV